MYKEIFLMAAIEAEDRAAVREDRTRPRLLLAQRMKPQRDRAVVRAFLRVLGVAFAELEVIAPVEAPIDVRFRQAQFHLRELGGHPRGCAWQEHDTRVHQASTLADRGDLRNPAVGMELAVSVSHITATLAEHAAWYGARCVGLDVVVSADEHYCLLAQPAEAPEIGALALQGWRSVSVLCPPYGMVLYTASGAPEFLRLVTGRLLRQWDNIETLFAGVKH
jgi:Putative endonuclease, protein of unknown function (DUF1780)